ncbi:hypothetical protein [Devosia ginsengisoli]|uniref:Uncharacterized protein n=1 Tax=Devosia ginsengisoli TaxID=400770 RepID=A0A5B8LSS0_9HYPH|nr:hypothetical protein [Devosia ginsengisoli]QDZ10542.1 hypothetical protein FPZ08_07130 [Devosia ginsengisoli]
MLSMPHSRKVIRKQDEVADRLRKELKAAGMVIARRKTKRERLIEAAKSGRPANLREQAIQSLSKRRAASQVQASLDMIAGRSV